MNEASRIKFFGIAFWLLLASYSLGFALTVCTFETSLEKVILRNHISRTFQDRSLFFMICAIVGFGGIGLANYFYSYPKQKAETCVIEKSILLFKCVTNISILALCFCKPLWNAEPYAMMVLLLLGGVIQTSILNDRRVKPTITRIAAWVESYLSPWLVAILLISVVICFSSYFSYFTILNHLKFGTHAYDLGVIENAFAHTIHSKFMVSSYLDRRNFLAVHFAVITLLAIPFYAAFNGPEILLILQSSILGLSAIPLYFLAHELLKKRAFAFTICCLYLLHPAHHTAIFHDVNELSALSFFFFALLYAVERKRMCIIVLTSLLVLSVKDDMPYFLLPVALFAWIRSGRSSIALVLGGFAVFWWYVSGAMVIRLGGVSYPYLTYFQSSIAPESSGIEGVIRTLLVNPLYIVFSSLNREKIFYFIFMFAPFAFICFRRLHGILLLLYGLVVLTATSHPPIFSVNFQYVWYLLPTGMAATLFVLSELNSSPVENEGCSQPLKDGLKLPMTRASMGLLILTSTLVLSSLSGAVLNRENFRYGTFDFLFTAVDSDKLSDLAQVKALIPLTARVSADEAIGPHLPEYLEVTTFRYFRPGTDFILVWRYGQMDANRLSQLKNSGSYRVVHSSKYFELLRANSDLAGFKSQVESPAPGGASLEAKKTDEGPVATP